MEREPTHPGVYIKEDIIDELGFTEKQLAERLSIKQEELSEIINGNKQITEEIVKVLSEITKTTEQFWLNLQQNHNAYLHHNGGHPFGKEGCIICQK